MATIRVETRHAVVLVAGTGVTTLLGLAYGLYATRTLDAEAVGEFTHALSIIAFLQIAFGPINSTVAKFTAEYAAGGATGRIRSLVTEIARRVAGYGLIALVVATAVAFPLAAFWKYESPAPLMIAFAITYALLLLSVARGALRGLQSFGTLNTNTIFEAALRLLIGLALLACWIGSAAALVPYLAALAATLLLSARQLKRCWSNTTPEPVDGRAIRQFAWPMFLLMLTSAAFQNIDMLFAKRVFAAEEAGAYGIAFYLTGRAVAVLVTPFNTLMLPLLAGRHGAGRPVRMTFLRVCGYFLILATVPLVLFAVWPEQLIGVLYGDRYTGAVPLLFSLAAARLAGHLCHMIGLAHAASGRFAFLYIYFGGLVAQFAVLLIWHDTPSHIVYTLLATQTATLAVMAIHFLVRLGATSPPVR